ncbi:MAG: pyruvate carboxyltransferase, partial [Nanoarchaeota archaeon]
MGIFNYTKKQFVHYIKDSDEILVSDTTLRDGEQMPGVLFTPENKREIADYLTKMGVYSIDAGFPVCSEGERRAIKEIAKSSRGLINPIITTLSRAKREDIDASYETLSSLNRARRGISIFLGSSPQHRKKLGKEKEEIIEMTRDSINYAKGYFNIISFAPEDASRTELEFLIRLYETAIVAGVSCIGFTDTVGYLTPSKTKEYVNEINRNVTGIEDVLFAIHFHNDLGLAVANSLEAIKTGYVDIFQGTIAGIGERSGNTAIEPVVMALKLHKE